MVEPNYMCNYSLMESKVQVRGNLELVKTLRAMVNEKMLESIDLYEASDLIREYCVDTYGVDFYEKNAEAILFIVENEYCNVERSIHPAFDMKGYIEDMKNGVMY